MKNPEKKSSHKPTRRHLARAFALQALYQWQFTQGAPEHIAKHFIAEHAADIGDENNIDVDYFQVLVLGALQNCEMIDQTMTPFLDRPLVQLDPVELSALRLAIFELRYRSDVPHAVVINEAIELAKEFGATDGYKFVNAVLNAIVKK